MSQRNGEGFLDSMSMALCRGIIGIILLFSEIILDTVLNTIRTLRLLLFAGKITTSCEVSGYVALCFTFGLRAKRVIEHHANLTVMLCQA